MDDKKVKLLQVKETDQDGKFISSAVEKNMIASAIYDGDRLIDQIMSGDMELGEDPYSKALGFKKEQFDEMFEDASQWFDRNGIITSSVSQISEPSYIFTPTPNTVKEVKLKDEDIPVYEFYHWKKPGLFKRFILWMKKLRKNT